jgi:hypothetical protein
MLDRVLVQIAGVECIPSQDRIVVQNAEHRNFSTHGYGGSKIECKKCQIKTRPIVLATPIMLKKRKKVSTQKLL